MIVWAYWRGSTASIVLGDLEMHECPRSVMRELHRACLAVWRDGRAETALGGYGWAFKLWGHMDGQENG